MFRRVFLQTAVVLLLCLSVCLCALAQTPTALPYTMTTYAGVSPITTSGTQCPGLPSGVKSTDAYGDGCLAFNGAFGSAGRGGVVVDAFGNVFVSDDIYNVVHMIDSSTGIMSVAAGGNTAVPSSCSSTNKVDSAGDGCIAATQTYVKGQRGMGIDPWGNLLLAGYSDNMLHVVCRAASPYCTTAQIGTMQLLAGCVATKGGSATSGVGANNTPAASVGTSCTTSLGEVDAPRGITSDIYGNVYFADTNSSRWRVILGQKTSSYFSGNNPLWTALGVYNASLTAGYAYTVVNISGTSTTTGGTATTKGATCSVTTNSTTYSGTALDTYGDGCPFEFSSVDAASGYTNGVAVDAAGNMLFADPTHGLRVFFVSGAGTAGAAMMAAIMAYNSSVTPQSGFIYMLAGGASSTPGSTPIAGNAATFDSSLVRVAVSPQGNIYLGDTSRVFFYDINTGYIRALFTGSSNVTAGSYCNGSSGQKSLSAYSDGCPASQSVFSNSNGLSVAVDPQGNLYLYDATSSSSTMLVRKVLAQGLAGQSLGNTLTQTFQMHLPETAAGTVSGATATLSATPDVTAASPACTQNADESVDCSVTVTAAPSAAGLRSAALTVALPSGSWENAQQSIALNGTVSGSVLAIDDATSAGVGLPNTTTILGSYSPSAIAADGAGNVYAAAGTAIYEYVAASSTVNTLATTLSGSATSIAIDPAGDIFYTVIGATTIQELTLSTAGSPSTYTVTALSYAPTGGTAAPQAVATDAYGNVYVADLQSGGSSIYKLNQSGNTLQSQTTVASGLTNPVSIAVDRTGNVFVADEGAGDVYKMAPSVSSSTGVYSYTKTTVLSSVTPVSVAVDPAGDVYLQDKPSETVLDVPLSGPSSFTVLSGLSSPAGLAVDGLGRVYSLDTSTAGITQVQRSAIMENFGSSTTTTFSATLSDVGSLASSAQTATATTGAQAADFTLAGGSSNGCTFTSSLLNALSVGQTCTLTAAFPALGNSQQTDYIAFGLTSPATSTIGVLTLTGLADTEAFPTTTVIGAESPSSPVYSPSGTEVSFPITVTASSSSSDGIVTNNTSGPTTSDYVTVSVDGGAGTNYYFTSTNGLSASLTLNLSALTAVTHSFKVTFPLQGEFLPSQASSGNFPIGQISTSVSWTPAVTTQQVSTPIGASVLNAAVTPTQSGHFVYSVTAQPSCSSTSSGTSSANTIDASTYLPIGTYTLYATFCPSDSTDIATATGSVSGYTVTQATATAAVGATTNVVAADGTGNYTSLSAALAALPTTGGAIYIKPGTYTGQNAISYPNVSLRGLGGDPTQVVLAAEDGAFSNPYTGYMGTGIGSGNASANGDQGSSTLDVSKSYYMGQTAGSTNSPVGLTNTTQYTPTNFYAEYLTVQNTWNTDSTTKSNYSNYNSACQLLPPAIQNTYTLQQLYNGISYSGTSYGQCSSQALALWLTGDQAILNNVNLISQQDTLYAGSQGCTGSTCTPARQYVWKGTIAGNVDYVFGDGATVFDQTNFLTTWHGTTATGTETIEAQNKRFQTGGSGDYLSGYVCNGCTLMSESTGMTNLYYGRPYGTYSTWIMLNDYVDQVNKVGWIEFTGDNNLPTSTYAEYNSMPYTDPAPLGTFPYPCEVFNGDPSLLYYNNCSSATPGAVATSGGNSGSGVTSTSSRESYSSPLTAAGAVPYYPINFLSTTVPTQFYTGFTSSWNPATALASQVNAFAPAGLLNAQAPGTPITILGRPRTPGAGVVPTGTYAFYDSLGTNQVCSAASSSCTSLASGSLDNSGEAYLTTTSLAAGVHYLTMVYGGDSNFTASTSATYAVHVLTASQTATTTTLSVNNASSTYGTAVTGTVTLSPVTADGTVTILLDGSATTTCTLSSGSCSWSISGISTGSHTLLAIYSGDSNYGWSQSSSVPIAVVAPVATGDPRPVAEPSFPSVCQQLTATLQTDISIQDLDASVDSTTTNIDGARIQAALNACAGTGKAVELSMDSTSTYNAFLSGPLSMPSNVNLLVDPNVTLYFSRNVQDYDAVSGTHTCGTINAGTNTANCLPLIDIPGTSTNVGIMGNGKLNGRGGDTLFNTFTSSGYSMPATPTWWNLASQANGEGNQQNPRFIQIEGSASNVTLYKITILNSPNFHVSTTGPVSGLTAWGVKIVTPTAARNTDGIDPGSVTNATVAHSWISDGDDNVAVGGHTNPSANISVVNNRFFAGHGESIGSLTDHGVSNVLYDHNMLAGNDFAGYGSAQWGLAADTNSTGIRIKSANDRGGLVTNIQYSNSCILDHKADIQFTPYYSAEDTGSYPDYTNILMQNLIFENDAGGSGTVELTGEFNSNSGGTPVIYPLGLTMDNVTFPSALSSLVNSTSPVEGTSVWNGSYSGGTSEYTNLTLGPGTVSGNFLTAYSTLVNNPVNFDTLTNNISLGSLDSPSCDFTYLAPELTGPQGVAQTIVAGNAANLDLILTPAVGGAPYPTGSVTLTDTSTSNTFTGTLSGTGDTLIVTIPASDLTAGKHVFQATYAGDSNYSVPAADQTFGNYTVNVVTNVTSSVSIKTSGLAYSRSTKTGTETFTITNTGSSTITGPIDLVLVISNSAVKAANATGTFLGNPYWSAAGSLAPGAAVTISVSFSYTLGAVFTTTPTVYSGGFN
jgi:polygalacturonase/pectin methylesterase-like acyl-CoA thioesterase